jgi:hypothetical protein
MKTKSHLPLIISILFFILNITIYSADPVSKPYPLKNCIVTDNELGSMGKIITKVYDNQEIKFCCKPCVKKFEANQSKYLNKLTQK